MTKRFPMVVLGMALLLGLIAAPGSAERTPPGSFLVNRVTNAQDLSSQVTANKVVANRYSNFYKTSPVTVAERFEGLKYGTLSSNMRTRVHFIGKGGRIISEMRNFKAGYPVFFDSRGVPVLDARCGNPLTTELPAAPKQVAAAPAPAAPPAAPESAAVGQGAEVPEELMIAEAAPLELPSADPVISQVLAQPVEILVPEIVSPIVEAATPPAVGSPAEIIATASGGGLGWLGLLAIPAVIVATDSGTSGEVIPEPGAVTVLATGLAGMAVMFRRTKRS